MKKLVFDIYYWIKNPDSHRINLSLSRKILLLCQVLVLKILMVIPFMAMIGMIETYILSFEYQSLEGRPIVIVAALILVLSVIEEFIFRFPLKYKRNYLFRFIDRFLNGRIEKIWISHFKYFVYSSILLFGFVHLLNYKNSEPSFYLFSPFIIGGQLLAGVFYSYVRIKLGFIWSVLLHISYNSILVVLTFFP
jgi:CAAX amino terminal protease family.